MRDRVWISFDLAPGGDRDGMYAWLRSVDARECGPALATFVLTFEDDPADTLQTIISRAVRLGPADRVYVLYKDPVDGEVTGRFVFGSRAERRSGACSRPPMTMLQ